MIFPRSPRRRNAIRGLAGSLFLVLTACAPLPAHPPNVALDDAHIVGFRLAFSRDSATLASAGSEGRIRLWRLPDAAPLASWKAHDGSIHGLVFFDNDRLILSGGYDGTLAVWNRDGRLKRRIATPAAITSLVGSTIADRFVTGHHDGSVRVWKLSTLEPLAGYRPHRGAVHAVAYHPASGRYASSGDDGRVFTWKDGGRPGELAAPRGDARALAFSPDGATLTGSGWYRLYRWSMSEPAALKVLPTEHHGVIVSIQYTRDGRRLATISRNMDSAVILLDAETGRAVRRFRKHDLCGGYVLLSPDERYLATTSDDSSVRIWDLDRLRPLQ